MIRVGGQLDAPTRTLCSHRETLDKIYARRKIGALALILRAGPQIGRSIGQREAIRHQPEKGASLRTVGHMRAQQDTRKRFVQAAIALFSSRGYHNTTLTDIARESGYTRAAVRYYFSSKEELGYAAIDEWMQLFTDRAAGSRLQTEEHPIDRLLKMLDDFPTALQLEMIGSSAAGLGHGMAAVHEGFRKRLGESLSATVGQIEGVIRKGVADGQIAPGVDPGQLAHIIATVCAGITHASLLWEQDVIWEDTRRWMKEYLNSLRR